MADIQLNSIDEIVEYFKKQECPYYFVSATNFNLMSMHESVGKWENLNIIDCYSGNNSSVKVPKYSETPVFLDIESINKFILGNKDIVKLINLEKQSGYKPKVLFLFYDSELENMVVDAGMDMIMPENKLVKNIDSKIRTTEIGNSVGVPSVPNALVNIRSYDDLKHTIAEKQLGEMVVVQTAYGDSGKTTFFIEKEDDYTACSETIESEQKVKVMKYVDCIQVAIEACATRMGTYIGPILTEIIGHPRLTPYKGGWCGNDVNSELFGSEQRITIYDYTEKLGKALYASGYRGYFEVDYLVEKNSTTRSEVYLGEINPRVTGISALTNMSDFCTNRLPLFLFHLLEFSDIKFSIDSKQFNTDAMSYVHPDFGQLIFKYTKTKTKVISEVPKTGIYSLEDRVLTYKEYVNSPSALAIGDVYILRILQGQEYVYKGADILILFAKVRMQNEKNELTPLAIELIDAVESKLQYRDLTEEEVQVSQRYGKSATIKTSTEN